jgi:hypothetical protein
MATVGPVLTLRSQGGDIDPPELGWVSGRFVPFSVELATRKLVRIECTYSNITCL